MLLFQREDGSYRPWNTGATRFIASEQHGRHMLSVGVHCRLGSLEEVELALLDTGAAWSVVSADTVEPILDTLGAAIRPVEISTRFGLKEGQLHRLNIVLLADQGSDLVIEATFAVIDHWPGPTVLGWSGALERVNLALLPGAGASEEPTLLFGPTGVSG
jgi:hypothetical protein